MSSDPRAFAHARVNPATRNDYLICAEMEHTMAPFAHDLLRFKVVGVDDTDQTRWTTGVPVSITYGRWPTAVTTFYGYIGGVNRTWVQIARTAQRNRVMEVWCIGASYPLKTPLAAIYTGQTSSQIATSIATGAYFDIDIPATSYTWPQKSAPGTSTWEFLADLAKASGCILYCHKTQIRFYDPITILLRNNTTVPVFYEKDTPITQSANIASVLDFHSEITEMSELDTRRKRTRVIQGLDAVTGAPIYATSATQTGPSLAQRNLAPQFQENVTDLVALSQADAVALLPARTTANRFYARARARVAGDVRITQESPIVFEGLGTRDSGIWQVIEAIHVVKKNWYSTDMVLGRDSDYDNGVRPGLAPGVLVSGQNPTVSSGVGPPSTVLANGRWRTAYSSGALNAA